MSFWKKKESSTSPSESADKLATVLPKPAVLGDEKRSVEPGSPGQAALSVGAESQKVAPAPHQPSNNTPATGLSPQVLSPKVLSVDDALTERYGKVRSALGVGTVIQGKLSFDMPVRIDGKLSGEIFSSRAIIVGVKGSVDARVEVAALIVQGKVKGSLKASERIEVYAGASVEGTLEAPVILVQEGAKVEGNCLIGPRVRETASLHLTDQPARQGKSDAVLADTVPTNAVPSNAGPTATVPAELSSIDAPTAGASVPSAASRAGSKAEARLH